MLSSAISITTGNVDVSGVLRVASTEITTVSNSYGFFSLYSNSILTGVAAPGTISVGISAPTGAVQAAQFVAISDKRLKKDIVSVDADELADVLRNLRVSRWKYRDDILHGGTQRLGFVAQEVEQVLPEAVLQGGAEFVPDIYKCAQKTGPRTYAFALPMHATPGSLLRIIPPGKAPMTVRVVSYSDETNSIEIDTDDASDTVFVYGSFVDSIKNLDFDALTAAAIGALQHLQKKVSVLEETVEHMRQKTL